MNVEHAESIHFWQVPPLSGVELLTARYIEHRFAPPGHDGFVAVQSAAAVLWLRSSA